MLEPVTIDNEILNCSGVISQRKARGKKHVFMMSGPNYHEACGYIAWEHVPANVLIFWSCSTENGTVQREIVRPKS